MNLIEEFEGRGAGRVARVPEWAQNRLFAPCARRSELCDQEGEGTNERRVSAMRVGLRFFSSKAWR